jgi:hypothetical protein
LGGGGGQDDGGRDLHFDCVFVCVLV